MSLKFVSPQQAAVRPGVRNPNWTPEDEAQRPKALEFFGPITGNSGADVTDVQMLNRTIGRHSHEVDEFQIMLGRAGSLFEGRPIPPLLVHYSDAFALYGPLTGADQSLHLVQLRAKPIDTDSAGAWGDYRLPDDRHLMPYVSERHEEAVVPPPSSEPLAPGAMTSENLIKTDDGVGTVLVVAGPSTEISVDSPEGSSGQFIYVANGALEFNGEMFGEGSIGWQPPAEENATLTAGESGCRIIVMRLPFPATRDAHAMAAKAASQS